MARLEIVRPYVESVLKEFSGVDELIVDEDDDIPFRRGSTMYWVSMFENNEESQIRVWSFLARNVDASPELYEHINDINSSIRYGRVYFEAGNVIVSHELLAEGLDKRELENACQCIGGISDSHDDELVGKFGGEVFFAAEEGEETDV